MALPQGVGGSFYARAGAVIAASTIALTAAFVGVVALGTRGMAGVDGRLPYYVLVGAVVFVAALLVLDDEGVEGGSVIAATASIGLTTFVVVSLAVEGVVFAVNFPDLVFASRLIVYFLSAGLICTGLTYWGLNHWREFVGSAGEGSL